jgi:hypothetical protein
MITKLKFIFSIITVLFTVNSGIAQVGINTTNPLSTLDINGTLSLKTVTLNGNGTGNGGAAVLVDDGVYVSINPISQDDKSNFISGKSLYNSKYKQFTYGANYISCQFIISKNFNNRFRKYLYA